MRPSTLTLLASLLISPAAWPAEQLSFLSEGVRIRYQVEGAGEPVLLIHGFRANGDLNWRLPGVVATLAEDFRVIVIDNRGHGRSDKPEEDGAYGVKMVGDAVGLLDHLGVESAHVVGYSMGGMITLKLLAEHPQRVRSAIVGGMGWTAPGSVGGGREGRATASGGSSRMSRAMVACSRGFSELAITRQELEAIAVPTLVLIGSEDGLLERRVRPLQEVRPDIPVSLIDGANHTSCIVRPEFRQQIQAFLVEQAGALRGSDVTGGQSR